MQVLYGIEGCLARRRARQQWRDFRVILFLILLFVLCTTFNCACGVVAYNLQRLGLLPTTAPTPTGRPPTITLTPVGLQPASTPTPGL